LEVKYSLLDAEKRLVIGDPSYQEFVNDIGELEPSEAQNPKEHPYELLLQFSGQPKDERCFVLELLLNVEPIPLLSQHLKCSEAESKLAGQIKTYDWEFGAQV